MSRITIKELTAQLIDLQAQLDAKNAVIAQLEAERTQLAAELAGARIAMQSRVAHAGHKTSSVATYQEALAIAREEAMRTGRVVRVIA